MYRATIRVSLARSWEYRRRTVGVVMERSIGLRAGSLEPALRPPLQSSEGAGHQAGGVGDDAGNAGTPEARRERGIVHRPDVNRHPEPVRGPNERRTRHQDPIPISIGDRVRPDPPIRRWEPEEGRGLEGDDVAAGRGRVEWAIAEGRESVCVEGGDHRPPFRGDPDELLPDRPLGLADLDLDQERRVAIALENGAEGGNRHAPVAE